jgi:molybdate/tungstate transport system substrate-binding protein
VHEVGRSINQRVRMWRVRANAGRRGAGRSGRGAVVSVFVSCCLLFGSGACKSRSTEVVVFYASSLSAVLGDAAEAFQKQNPNLRIRLEPSGSQVAARKVAELGMRADIVAVADAALIGKMLIPANASWSATFATNEIVLAHMDHSKWTDQITAQSWPEILTRPGLRLGRADPDTAPVGYQTLMVWQLAESSGLYGASAAGLAGRLMGQCSKAHVTHDEAELLALLESRAIDYAFLFRSTAEDHHLKILTLPPEINLSRSDLAARYASAQVQIRMRQGQGKGTVVGAPVTYGVTIPTRAPHSDAAARFLAFLLGPEGKRLLERRGFHPALPAACNPCSGLPEQLRSVMAFSRAAAP